MLQKETPEDYILATGKTHSVREFIERAFGVVGIHIIWQGIKENEIGVDEATGKIFVKHAFFRNILQENFTGCFHEQYISITPDAFHGEWNYMISPRKK